MEKEYEITYNINERNALSEIFSEPIFTSIPEWRKPDFTNAYTFDNKPNFIWVNPELKKFIRRKLRRKKNKGNFLYHYLYVCSTINHLKVVDKRFENDENVPLNYKILTSVISRRKYKEIIGDLISWGIIEINESYQSGNYSKGFKLLPPYNQNLKKIKINDDLMNEKLSRFKQQSIKDIKNLPLPYKYLAVTNTWIELDYESASTYNIEHYFGVPDVYGSNYYSITGYDGKEYRFRVDKFGNRAHTNLTNLSKSMRQFLHVDAETLGQVDIKNSQPLFFYLHIKYNTNIPYAEKVAYKQIVENGRFYELFMDELGIDESKREETKPIIIANVFYDKIRPTENRYMRVFRQKFPSIAEYLTNIRRRDNKRLAQILQKAESKFIIEKAVAAFVRKFGHQWEFVSTIHDSIVVKTSMLSEAEQIVRDCFKAEGIYPQLTVKAF